MTSKELFETLLGLSGKAKVDPALEALVLVELGGSDPALWTAKVDGGGVSLTEGRPENPDLTISGSSETAVAIFQKKLNPLMALMTGKVKIKGDMGKVTMLKSLLAAKKKS